MSNKRDKQDSIWQSSIFIILLISFLLILVAVLLAYMLSDGEDGQLPLVPPIEGHKTIRITPSRIPCQLPLPLNPYKIRQGR